MKKILLSVFAMAFAASLAAAKDCPAMKGKDAKGLKCPAMQTEAISGEVVSVDKIKDRKCNMQEVTLKTAKGEQKVLLCTAKSDHTRLKAGDKLDLKVCKGPGEKKGQGVKYCAAEGTCNGSAMKMDMKSCPMMKSGDEDKGKKDKSCGDMKKGKKEKKIETGKDGEVK